MVQFLRVASSKGETVFLPVTSIARIVVQRPSKAKAMLVQVEASDGGAYRADFDDVAAVVAKKTVLTPGAYHLDGCPVLWIEESQFSGAPDLAFVVDHEGCVQAIATLIERDPSMAITEADTAVENVLSRGSKKGAA